MKRNGFPITIGGGKPGFRSAAFPTLLVALAAVMAPAPGSADTLPPSTADEELTRPDGMIIDASTTPGCVPAGIGVFPSLACTKLGPDPSVSVSDSTSTVEASAEVAFHFDVLGPPQVAVPIIISGTAAAFSQPGAEFSGEIALGSFNDPSSFTSLLEFNRFGSPPPGGTFMQTFTIHTFAESDTTSEMLLGVGCSVLTDGAACRSAIDPAITIDPSFAEASQFSVVESTGSTGTVPEPSPLLLFGTGLLVLVRKLRRNRVTR